MEPVSAISAAVQLCGLASKRCDIVLVHGLERGSLSTWATEHPLHEAATRNTSGFVELAHALKTMEVRIFSYTYKEMGTRNGIRHVVDPGTIHEHARLLLRHMLKERCSETTKDRPVVFIAHSLGGLIVQQAIKFSKDTHNIYSYPYTIYGSTKAILFYIPPSQTSYRRHKMSERLMDSLLDDGPLILRCPDPDQFPVTLPHWKQQILLDFLLLLAQIPLIAIVGSYKWPFTRETISRSQMSTPSVLWPLIRCQLCPLSQQKTTSDCTILKDLFLDPTPSLFVSAALAYATLYMLYHNRHRHHRYQDLIVLCGLLFGVAIHIYLCKQAALPKLASFALPSIMLSSIMFSSALHTLWGFYSGHSAIELAHEHLRAWARTTSNSEDCMSEKSTSKTIYVQSAHEI